MQKIYNINTDYGYTISCTGEHRLINNNWEECKANAINIGDQLIIQANQQFFIGDNYLDNKKFAKVTNDLAYVIGSCFAWGASWEDHITVKINNELLDRLGIVYDTTTNDKRWRYNDNNLIKIIDTDFLDIINKYSFNQVAIPSIVFKWPREQILSFISGMICDDVVSSKWSYVETDWYLINQLQMLLLNCGIITKAWYDGYTCHYFLRFLIAIESDEVESFPVAVTSINIGNSPVCEISVESDDHLYISNGFISHNSQVARTVILAYIKKENRDHKNIEPYTHHVDRRTKVERANFDRFIEEAREVCKYNSSHLGILNVLVAISKEDDRPADGLISKLIERSGQTRAQILNFLKLVRLRSDEFTDSPKNENSRQRYRIDGS